MPWWRFWRPETQAEMDENARQKASVLALENGDIPPLAKNRIELTIRSDKKFFSSDLSVREFLLTKESGIEAISQVMGSAFYNVSYWGSYMGPYRMTGELAKVTHAQLEARRLAISRMIKEAQLLGASGVIGVRLNAKPSSVGSRMTEFTAYGTAVRIPNYPTGAEPFASDLNGQDFWQLYKSGYRPKGLVMGLCSYYIWTNWRTNMQMYGLLGFGSFNNQEVQLYTQGFYNARNLAVDRLTQQLYELQADGCIGMKIDYEIEKVVHGSKDEQIDLLITFSALGTAVDAGSPVEAVNRLMCIDLRKSKKDSVQVKFNDFKMTSDMDGTDDEFKSMQEDISEN
jgi:uncharacterized protein YbjQ (UPF0145 family)